MKTITTFALALIGMCFCSIFNLQAQFSGGGTGTSADPFKIKTANDLNNMRNYVGSANASKHFRLVNDIDLTAFLQDSTAGWMPIGDSSNEFTGYFHGGGHKINGLWINRPTIYDTGFFGENVGTIDSLTVVISAKSITGGTNVGGFVGTNVGTIMHCVVEGGSAVTISGGIETGGFVGYNNSKISSCYATVSVSSSAPYSSGSANSAGVGGFVGYNNYAAGYRGGGGIMDYCYTLGNVSSNGINSGGLIGVNKGMVSNCYATGNATGGVTSGGLIGRNFGRMYYCYATGNASASDFGGYICSGGLIGRNAYESGIISDVYGCYASGNASASGSNNYSGGFVGYTQNRIRDSYAVGYVTSDGSQGAFAGYCDFASELSQCYYNSDINGSMSSVGNNIGSENVFGKNTAAMKSKATFVNWDFSTVWTIKEGVGYPYFQWQDATSPTGIQFIQKYGNTMAIFPNPATDQITVSGLYAGEMLYIYNVSGQQLLFSKATGEAEQFAVSHLPSGIYVVKTSNGQVLKWIKK